MKQERKDQLKALIMAVMATQETLQNGLLEEAANLHSDSNGDEDDYEDIDRAYDILADADGLFDNLLDKLEELDEDDDTEEDSTDYENSLYYAEYDYEDDYDYGLEVGP